MIYSTRARRNRIMMTNLCKEVMSIEPIATHSLPMLPAKLLYPIQSAIEVESDERIMAPTCAVKMIDVTKLLSIIKTAMKEFDDQVKARS